MLTRSLSQEAFAALGGPALVYVRAIKAQEILGETSPEDLEAYHLDPEQMVYALHRADGARLAVLADRDSAYAAARAHELVPVSVH